MVSGIQMKLRGFSIVENVHDQWTKMDNKTNETSGNFFTQLLSSFENFFEYLLRSFDNILPPENPDEPISHWIHLVAKYLAVGVVVILGICCFICLFSCLVSSFSCLLMCIFSTVQYLFMCVFSTVRYMFMCIFIIVRSLFWCILFTVGKILSFLGVTMMRAPGMALLLIPRALFQAFPQVYFAILRVCCRGVCCL